jgi:hypothetical protein
MTIAASAGSASQQEEDRLLPGDLTMGTLAVRLAASEQDIEAAQALRWQIFYQEGDATPSPDFPRQQEVGGLLWTLRDQAARTRGFGYDGLTLDGRACIALANLLSQSADALAAVSEIAAPDAKLLQIKRNEYLDGVRQAARHAETMDCDRSKSCSYRFKGFLNLKLGKTVCEEFHIVASFRTGAGG